MVKKSPRILKIFFQLLIGIIFFYASIGKLLDIKNFADAISKYDILPFILVKPFAVIMPIIEMLIGTFMILNVMPKISLITASAMLIIFVIAILSAIIRGINIDCGCFSNIYQTSEPSKFGLWIAFIRTVFLFLICFYLILQEKIIFSKLTYKLS